MKNRLEELRKQREMKPEDLAYALEVSRQTIGSLENGRYNPSVLLAFKIASFFRCVLKIFLFMRRTKKMKNRNIVWYVGYALSLLLVLLIAITDLPREADFALGILFFVLFAVSHTQLLHNRTLRNDKDYRINVSDERNIYASRKRPEILLI